MNGVDVITYFNYIALNGGEIEIKLGNRIEVESARLSFTRRRKSLAKERPDVARRLEFYSKHVDSQWSLVVTRLDKVTVDPRVTVKDISGNVIEPEVFQETLISNVSAEPVSTIRKGPERIYDIWKSEVESGSLSDLFDFVAKGMNMDELSEAMQEIYAELYERDQACSLDLHSGITENNH